MDVTQLTDEQLNEYASAITAELQARNQTKQLLDDAWTLVMKAKTAGFTMQQVGNALTNVVKQAYEGTTTT